MPVAHANRNAAPTDDQLRFVRNLLVQARGDEGAVEAYAYYSEGGALDTRAGVSRLIDDLKAEVAKNRVKDAGRKRGAPMPDVPASRYALQGPDGSWQFFKVDRPTSGKWKGYTFCKRLYGAPGDFRTERMSMAQSRAVLERIVAARYSDGPRALEGPEAAAVAFSREHGVCAACASPLTDSVSVAAGMGPICRKRFAA